MSKKITQGGWLLLVAFLLPLLSLAQNVVTGHIFSAADQTPVAGATLIIKGTKIGVSTGLDGSFSIRAKAGDVLVVTGVGLTKQEVAVGYEQDLTIKVATDARNLNEVVVTALGIKKETK